MCPTQQPNVSIFYEGDTEEDGTTINNEDRK